MYQDERKLDFKPLGIAIKKAREAKGWTQEYLAQLVDLTPRSIMYIENRGQHPRLNKFYLITTLLDISVDQFFFPCNEDGDNNRRKQVDVLLNDMEEKELRHLHRLSHFLGYFFILHTNHKAVHIGFEYLRFLFRLNSCGYE